VGVEFSKNLVPAASLKLAKVAPGSFPTEAQDRQRYFVWMEKPGVIDLQIAVRKRWANRAPRLELFSPLEVTLAPVAVREDYQPDKRRARPRAAHALSGPTSRRDLRWRRLHPHRLARRTARQHRERHRHARRHQPFPRPVVTLFLRPARHPARRRLGLANCELGSEDLRKTSRS
jgi:hypothetical protein